MEIDNIIVQRSPIDGGGKYVMHVELNGYKFSGYFSDMPGYLTAIADMSKFFMVKMGKLSNAQAKATLEIADVKH